MLRILALIVISSILAVACTTDDHFAVIGGEEQADQQQIKLTLRIQTSAGENSSRSITGEDGNAYNPDDPNLGIEEGNLNESTVTNALLVLGNISPGSFGPTRVQSVHYLNNFENEGGCSLWRGVLKEKIGTYRMIVIANPLPYMSPELYIGMDWESLIELKIDLDYPDYIPVNQTGKGIPDKPQNIWSDQHFMMTNYFNNNISEHEITLLPKKDNIKEISVQRVCARFDYATNLEYPGNIFGVEGKHWEENTKITVTLEEVGLINLSKSFYLNKMFAKDKNLENNMEITSHAKESPDTYVADTDWHKKKNFANLSEKDLNEMYFFSLGNGKLVETVAPVLEYCSLPITEGGRYESLFYATENTVPGILCQVNKLTTGIVFKGHFTVEGISGKDVYYYKDYKGIYHITAELNEVNKTLNLNLQSDASDEELASEGIRKYMWDDKLQSYSVWYIYWNRHNDNRNPNKMGIMEFAVVRNNVYKLEIRKISFLGFPKDPTEPGNPWKPDGNTPDEEWPDLDVEFQVQVWNERTFDYEI